MAFPEIRLPWFSAEPPRMLPSPSTRTPTWLASATVPDSSVPTRFDSNRFVLPLNTTPVSLPEIRFVCPSDVPPTTFSEPEMSMPI